MIKSLQEARITDVIPRILAGQKWVQALSEAVAEVLNTALEYADASQIYTAIDTAPERILDALAVCWKIDWYDTGFTVEQKRRVVKNTIHSRRVMGTAHAVKAQATAVYNRAVVEEWFDYGGQPGYFRVTAELAEGGMSAEIYRQMIKAILMNKNVRSHLEGVDIQTESSGEIYAGAYTAHMARIDIWPEDE